MKDLINLVDYYIKGSELPKISECCYKKKYTLSDIASFINTLNTYKISIDILNPEMGNPYIGKTTPNLNLVGLEQGIKNTYNRLKNAP